MVDRANRGPAAPSFKAGERSTEGPTGTVGRSSTARPEADRWRPLEGTSDTRARAAHHDLGSRQCACHLLCLRSPCASATCQLRWIPPGERTRRRPSPRGGGGGYVSRETPVVVRNHVSRETPVVARSRVSRETLPWIWTIPACSTDSRTSAKTRNTLHESAGPPAGHVAAPITDNRPRCPEVLRPSAHRGEMRTT